MNDDPATAAAAAAATAAAVAAAKAATDANAALLGLDIGYIKRDIAEIKESIKSLSGEYITRGEFQPVQRIVYGLISVLGIATFGAIIKLILKV